MVNMVLGNFEKKNWPYVRLKCGLETSFGIPYQKSADTLKFVINQVSYISQQKKVNTISHVRQTEGTTILFSSVLSISFYSAYSILSEYL